MIDDAAYENLMARGRGLNRFETIDSATTALVAIDLQNGFVQPSSPFGMARARALLPLANRLAEAVRTAGGKVAWTRHTYTDHGARAVAGWQARKPAIATLAAALREGDPAHALHADLQIAQNDAGDQQIPLQRAHPPLVKPA